MEFEPGAGPDELKKAVIAEFKQGAAPARVRLLLKTEGSGTLVPLVSRKQVAQMEQSVEGTFVTAEVQAYLLGTMPRLIEPLAAQPLHWPY